MGSMLIRFTPNEPVASMDDMANSPRLRKVVNAGLVTHGVATMRDLDRWIAANPHTITKGPHAGEREHMSRFQALKHFVGEDTAIEMLNNLAIEQCA